MDRLKNKRALITGGTSGIGLETTRAFIKEGARVAITGTKPESLEAARKELGSDVLVIASNASDIPDQKALAEAIRKEFGGLDILFANAGVAEMRPLEQWDEAGFDRSFGINLKGMFFLVQALLPVFANPASIVLNGSVNARIGAPGSSVYAATKAGVISLARTLSGELIGRGIRANVVSAGPITTPLYDKLGLTAEQVKGMSEGLIARVPVHRFGTPSEFASAVLYFASDESAFTVGSELVVDGGMTNI
jgi:NAD(P)-dependent dehydrogenase (short-subunit alcohol dehydrogenase family)